MSRSELHLRKASTGDLPGVIALERTIPEAPHWPEAEYAVAVAAQNGGVSRCLFIAEIDGRLIGFAVGKVIGAGHDSFAELESVAVDAAVRRIGAGKALCIAVTAWSREQGASVLELEVRASSAGAIALYRGLGFVPAGRRAAYYRDPIEDALLMTLKL